jgi:hypothetical protein
MFNNIEILQRPALLCMRGIFVFHISYHFQYPLLISDLASYFPRAHIHIISATHCTDDSLLCHVISTNHACTPKPSLSYYLPLVHVKIGDGTSAVFPPSATPVQIKRQPCRALVRRRLALRSLARNTPLRSKNDLERR